MSGRSERAGGAVDAEVTKEATYGSLPLLKSERTWSAGDFSWVTLSLAIATWAFLTGGSTVLLVGFTDGIAAMLIGNSIGLAIMALGSVVLSQRLGVEQYRALKSVFGIVGVGIVVFVVVLLTEMGWSSLLGVMFGRAFSEISNQAFGTEFDQFGPLVTVFALLAIFVGWIILSRGPITISKLNRFVAPGLLVVVALMMVLLMSNYSWGDLLAAEPIAPFPDEQLNFMMAVEFNLGAGLSWWPVMGTLSRLTRGPRAALWPAYGGIFIGTVVAQLVGMAAGLMFGEADPTSWMVPLGGPILGVLTLLFVGFANVTSMASIAYSTVLAVKQSSGRVLSRLRWPVLAAAFLALPAVLSFFPAFMYEQFMTFVVISGAFIAALCGVIIADYFILRRQVVPLRALYASGADDPLRFTGGVNIAALASVAIASAFYLWVYNPITLETQAIFSFATATVPAVLIAMVCHVILSHLLYVRRGRGAYGQPDLFAAAGRK
ncbi:Predicted hydroxymethylpyrimidine transporter CytX [Leucobacter sp. 7(1)]|uniref:purine-cytosine permease family protein n=1 Tax=Leucobacter sp. 7(1) TaxID=1255613 RepID=UPI00097EAE51|nr:cytosine permease [Leucobacter sp. 7(1)]SJN11034.1 Predicted hydroxymethylpyrimidine transporter CytX [Leucobacter sp. 7(1)]